MNEGNKRTGNSSGLDIRVALVSLLFLYSFILTINYLGLNSLLSMPMVIHPSIKFVVGNPANANDTGMTFVPLNQTLCPENATIRQAAAGNNRYLYYTIVAPDQSFRYSLIYNSANYTFAYAAVLPPFKLSHFENVIQTRPDCAGYPNAMGNATMIIQAPTNTYYGSIYVVLYFSKK